MFTVKYRNTGTRCEICSKLTVKTPERRKWRCSGVFVINSGHILRLVSVSIVDFKQLNAGWKPNQV